MIARLACAVLGFLLGLLVALVVNHRERARKKTAELRALEGVRTQLSQHIDLRSEGMGPWEVWVDDKKEGPKS